MKYLHVIEEHPVVNAYKSNCKYVLVFFLISLLNITLTSLDIYLDIEYYTSLF